MTFFDRFKRLLLRTIGRWVPSDIFAPRMPISVKGVCFIDGRVILLKNEVGEWDLPGGKLSRKEVPEMALCREIKEELGIEAETKALLKATNIRVRKRINVLVLIYACEVSAKEGDLRLSYESFGVDLFLPQNIAQLKLHPAYGQAILQAVTIN